MFKQSLIIARVTLVVCFFSFCNQNKKPEAKAKSTLTIAIQPFNDISSNDVEFVEKKIKEFYPKVILLDKIDIPKGAFYTPRNRYKADSILKYFNSIQSKDLVYIGLTNKDISTKKGNVQDFGVMGLGFCPGKACVASTFRLTKGNKQEQLFKVAIHELGHTQGLPHCKLKFCFMRDAEGKNPTDEEKEFCESCKKHLKSRGWKI